MNAGQGRRVPTTNDPKTKQLLAALAAGHYIERSASLAGLNQATVHSWIGKGKAARTKLDEGKKLTKREQQWLEIGEAIEKARNAAAHRALSTITQAMSTGTWQAAAWYLERTDREHYGRVTRLEGTQGDPIRVQSVDEVEARLAELLGEDEG